MVTALLVGGRELTQPWWLLNGSLDCGDTPAVWITEYHQSAIPSPLLAETMACTGCVTPPLLPQMQIWIQLQRQALVSTLH
jgi:hypothetical protein